MLLWLFSLVLLPSCASAPAGTRERRADVCVYGATSAGIIAALRATRLGLEVVLLDADGWVGGLTTSGLGATDVGNQDAIGGLSRSFYQRLRDHYDRPEAWTWQTREQFGGRGHRPGEDAAWTFEPSVAQATFAAMLAEHGVVPVRTRLRRDGHGVDKRGTRVEAIHCEDGTTVRARVFLDCSYEGDLFAAAGCAWFVGREAGDVYGETLNGVQIERAVKHQFDRPVDPFVVPGDQGSGLLAHVHAGDPGEQGDGDRRVQAYCLRMCATDHPDNRVPWPKPADYDEREYELLLRYFEAGSTHRPWHPVRMPNRKTDSNNNGAFSTDYLGGSDRWPEASYAEREAIYREHLRYQQGLMWTLANHERVPADVRAHFASYGLARDEFVEHGHWPPMLYIREGRRLLGEAVVLEQHCMGQLVFSDPVGMGAYAMDSHNTQRYVAADGSARNEGDVQVRVPQPYGISYRALTPRYRDADNLLVPVGLSASHIAFGSVRMEPVFMLLADSAAFAAALAIERDCAVQDVPYPELRERLLAAGQVLSWPASGGEAR
ncbi:MAG: FAD-dependent oxidoreductase [Planctomycetota bacterium]